MKCDHPKCNVDADILFNCRFCQQSFCAKHRDTQDHNCPGAYQRDVQYGAQNQYSGQQGAAPGDVMRAFAEEINKQAQRAREEAERAQWARFSEYDDDAKKQIIEKRLKASPELFSLGNEVLDLIFGFGLIILVFGLFQFIVNRDWWGFLVSAILIGTAFIPHELSHKAMAQRRGQFARYILWVRGLMFTFLTLLIGIGLVVPGFVAIVPMDPRQRLNKKDTGIVAFAGPITNVIIGGISLVIALLIEYNLLPDFQPIVLGSIFFQIALFNGLIGAFNCIPLWQLDGKKILAWNKYVYFALLAAIAAIVVPPFLFNISLIS